MIKLDVHFSGLCAFAPNRTQRGKPADSWSVLLINLGRGFGQEGELATPIQPHFAALRYRLDQFTLIRKGRSIEPDLVLGGLPGDDHKRGVIQLEGKRIELDLPGSDPFELDNTPVSDFKNPMPGNASSIHWHPEVEALLSGAGTLAPLGSSSVSGLRLFQKSGFPARAELSAHVILRAGILKTSAFAPQGNQDVAHVWDFVTQDCAEEIVDTRATAYRLTLSAECMNRKPTIKIFDRFPENEMILVQNADKASCDIMNYELEEITGWVEGNNVEKGQIDSDFDLVYWLSQHHKVDRRCLPRYKDQVIVVKGKGLGSRRRTCAAARFSLFHEDDRDLLSSWGVA